LARLSERSRVSNGTLVKARIVHVVLDLPLAHHFDYLGTDVTPDDVGRIVVVPFGNKKLAGVIVALNDETNVPAEKLKPIILVQRELPKFSADDFTLFRFCESYYHYPFGAIALNAIPPAMRASKAIQSKTPRNTVAALGKQSVAATPTIVAGPPLTPEQRNAIAQITAARGTFRPMLLFGVTASGKTEVYLQVIADTLLHGLQALVLVPEINLTPQFLRQVQSRFPNANIVRQNSSMAAVARMRGYLDAQSGRADIVIGTRLAVFTPMPRLGVIIIDEEHDQSFKQQEGFRYSARDVAIFRAQRQGCVVVMGSATPSLESVQNVARGRFLQLTLTKRAAPNAVMPAIGFIDLNHERVEDGLSLTLIDAIIATVQRREQALVFINRRGFSPALVCAQCAAMPGCTRCSARLVFHQKDRRLKCHHCGYQSKVPVTCEACGSHELIPAGQGTERIEAALRAKLPNARIARVDRDSTRRRGAAEKIFDAAAAGEIDVLIGTQMLAKGHDFPKITLVGVVNADAAMFSADFRAAERMVAQLCQVAGRAGRADLWGRVLIQTRFATHPLYKAVAAQDHARFAAMALTERKTANLPPYTFLALLRAEAKSAEAIAQFMRDAVAAARQTLAAHPNKSLQIWDPVPAPLARKADHVRQQLMVQAGSRGALQKFLTAWLPLVRQFESRAVKWLIDVDPLEV
jgi:primosomal protein N' (replication factor Y)